jgi:hypothetical protein
MGYCKDCKNGSEYRGGIYCEYYRRVYDHYESCTTHFISKTDSGGGCYITTACVSAMGKKDDCYELQTLRQFRDTYLRSIPEGIADIMDYYSTAPIIVDFILQSDTREEVLRRIYHELVSGSIELIRQGKLKEAHEFYRSYVNGLKKEFFKK